MVSLLNSSLFLSGNPLIVRYHLHICRVFLFAIIGEKIFIYFVIYTYIYRNVFYIHFYIKLGCTLYITLPSYPHNVINQAKHILTTRNRIIVDI